MPGFSVRIERIAVLCTLDGQPRWSPSGRYLLASSADAVYYNSKALLIFDFQANQ